jgi:hypothetical protein
MFINCTAVEAISNRLVALGLGFTFWQLRESRKNRTMDFEDRIDREYREISKELPTVVLLKLSISDDQLNRDFKYFVIYFDLCNDENIVRKSGRINHETWLEWQDGMRQNLEFPGFAAAWKKVKIISTDRFRELRKLEELHFDTDPHEWKQH